MRIGHFSDLHGRLETLENATEAPDVWVCSGDIFPNKTRGIASVEVQFQSNWFLSQNFPRLLKGKPLLYVPGNHDYANLADLLREQGYPAETITVEGITFNGVRFAGFREVPYIQGEWNGESRNVELSAIAVELFNNPPDVLVTHAPPGGILGDGHTAGIAALTSLLTYSPHDVKAHLFGHIHEDGGKTIEELGVRFYNSAGVCQFLSV
jgi:Icc-related predicted phosphoesterase